MSGFAKAVVEEEHQLEEKISNGITRK